MVRGVQGWGNPSVQMGPLWGVCVPDGSFGVVTHVARFSGGPPRFVGALYCEVF